MTNYFLNMLKGHMLLALPIPFYSQCFLGFPCTRENVQGIQDLCSQSHQVKHCRESLSWPLLKSVTHL